MTTIYVKDTAGLPPRRDADFYPTERTLIRAALNRFTPDRADSILDIGAGDGRWGVAAWERTRAPVLAGIDSRPLPRPNRFTHWITADYLEWQPGRVFDLIVSNPPYRIAEPVIRRGWGQLAPGGTMIMLLRLAFQAGVNRFYGLWQEIPPVTVGVLSRRPSFYNGGTNGTDYGIYHWLKDATGGGGGQAGGMAGGFNQAPAGEGLRGFLLQQEADIA